MPGRGFPTDHAEFDDVAELAQGLRGGVLRLSPSADGQDATADAAGAKPRSPKYARGIFVGASRPLRSFNAGAEPPSMLEAAKVRIEPIVSAALQLEFARGARRAET